jgi:hypothetical protein
MAQQKAFTITGLCVPSKHYMVDTSAKIDLIIRDYIEKGAYFTINRARQFGKTTTLELLYQRLRERYVVIDMSFEGKDDFFDSKRACATGICRLMAQALLGIDQAIAAMFMEPVDELLPFGSLDDRFTQMADKLSRPVILMIDEVDKASDNQIFLTFLGLLRDKYLAREKRGTPTFKSVILAGVHDIKNLKMKIRPDEKHSYNSPWNIATRFDVDMSFSAPEIATMLTEYEQDYHTGMDIMQVAERLYYYTSGYPFLVSLLCKTIHDEHLNWSEWGVNEAEKRALRTNNTLFEDVVKNIINHPSLGMMIKRNLVDGTAIAFELRNPDIDLGIIYGILKEKDGEIAVSNAIFETILYDYFISIAETCGQITPYTENRSLFLHDGHLNMTMVLNRFAAFMKSEYREEDASFIERQGRLLFLSFLKPIINGTGQYTIEPETRGSRRMDLVVFYGGEEHIVELKIWHGEQAAAEAYDQLTGYLMARGQKEGYLLSFCDNQKAPREGKVFPHKGLTITEVVVAYRDKA